MKEVATLLPATVGPDFFVGFPAPLSLNLLAHEHSWVGVCDRPAVLATVQRPSKRQPVATVSLAECM